MGRYGAPRGRAATALCCVIKKADSSFLEDIRLWTDLECLGD